MIRLFTVSSALALAAASPAIAQEAGPMATPTAPTETPAPTAAPAPTEAPDELDTPTATQPIPVDPTVAAQPAPMAEPAAATAAAPAVDARAATVASLVETEFPSYDVDKSGDLNQPEFSKWVLALHAKAEASQAATAMDAKAKVTWAKNAFATADVDKSKKVSKAELQTFLLG